MSLWLRSWSVVLVVLPFGPGAVAGEPASLGRWIVAVPPALREALGPLIEHRTKQGFRAEILELEACAGQTPAQLAEALRQGLAKLRGESDGPSCVLLVGDWEPRDASPYIPAMTGVCGRMQGQPTDPPFAFPDQDGAPRWAVGRFPARNAAELRGMINKTIRFEQQRFGPWTNRIHVLGGNPLGRSALEQRAVETAVLSAAGRHLGNMNPRWRLTCILDIPNSPFTVPSDRFGQTALEVMSAGQLFLVYAGHANAGGMWSNAGCVVSRDEMAKLKIADSPGVFVSTGCYMCQIAGGDGTGFAIAAFRNPDGPVAAIGASCESYAALGQLALEGLVGSLNRDEPPSGLGDYWMAMQAGMTRGEMGGTVYWLLDQADGSRGMVSLADQRREHLEMWMLLGDPALQLPVLRCTADVHVAGELQPGGTLRIKADVGPGLEGARATITAESRYIPSVLASVLLGTPAGKMAAPIFGSPLAETQTTVAEGHARCDLQLADRLPDQTVLIRVVAAANGRTVMGACPVDIKRPTSHPSPPSHTAIIDH